MINLNDDKYQACHIWLNVLYNSSPQILDVYFVEGGHPKQVHDKFGAIGIEEFRQLCISKILSENNIVEFWRLTSDGYVILHKLNNIGEFFVNYKGLIVEVKKKTIKIDNF